MIEEQSKRQLAERLCERLYDYDYSPQYVHEVAIVFADLFAKEISERRSGVLGAMRGKYAIRSDDVKLFDVVATALPAAAGVGFVLGGGPALGATASVVIAVIRLLHRLVTRGVSLDEAKIRLLTILRSNVLGPENRGMTINEILEIVQRTQPDKDIDWVKRHLDELSSMPTYDRGGSKIVSQDSHGLWRSHA
jgi:hypothetical protein